MSVMGFEKIDLNESKIQILAGAKKCPNLRLDSDGATRRRNV
jgi:hypothetical protein